MLEDGRYIAAPQNTEEHPDSEQLRRFVADDLNQQERATMLQHLTGCWECRASLAVVAPEEGPPALASRASRKVA